MSITAAKNTVSHYLTTPVKKVGVNLQKIAKERGLELENFHMPDGSTVKLLSGPNEFDCVVMKNGKILTAKGKKCKDASESALLFHRVLLKLVELKAEIPQQWSFILGA